MAKKEEEKKKKKNAGPKKKGRKRANSGKSVSSRKSVSSQATEITKEEYYENIIDEMQMEKQFNEIKMKEMDRQIGRHEIAINLFSECCKEFYLCLLFF